MKGRVRLNNQPELFTYVDLIYKSMSAVHLDSFYSTKLSINKPIICVPKSHQGLSVGHTLPNLNPNLIIMTHLRCYHRHILNDTQTLPLRLEDRMKLGGFETCRHDRSFGTIPRAMDLSHSSTSQLETMG